MRAVGAVVAVMAVMAVVVRPAYAQETSVPARLTLRDAIEIARERNPDYQQALNTYHAQGAQVRAGWGAFLPTLSARMSFAGSDSRTVTGQDDYGQPVELPAPITFQGSSSNQSVSAGITLFDGLRNLHSLRSARASQAAADAARWAARTRLDAETTRRFYDALRAAQLIALEERLLASAKEQYANTERLFRTASATQEDLLGAEADVLNQELQLDQAQGTARKALLALRELLGITEPIDFEVAGDLPAVWDPETLAADSLVSVALAEHPQLQQLEANANAAELRAAAAHGGYWPRIQAAASFSRSVNLGSYQALFDLNPRNRSFGFSLSLDLPLFTGFQTSAQVAQASADAENAEATLRAGALALERDVRAALVDLKNAYRALALAERASELSSERLRLSRERYAIGAITFANLQLLIDRAAQQERQLTNARYGYAAAVATLDERVGQVVRP